MIKNVYLILIWLQWAILALNAAVVIIFYVLGFCCNMLEMRWIIIPITLLSILIYGVLSLMIMIIFIWKRVFSSKAKAEYDLLSALPSIIMVACIIGYLLH